MHVCGSHGYGGLGGAEMEVVDGTYERKSQGLVACRSNFPVLGDYNDNTRSKFTALGRIESELVGRPGKTLARDDTRKHRLVVLAGGWLHFLVPIDIFSVVTFIRKIIALKPTSIAS